MKAKRILCLFCIFSVIFSLCSCSVSNDSEIQSETSSRAQNITTEVNTTVTEQTTAESATSSTTTTSSTSHIATSKKSVTKKHTSTAVKPATTTTAAKEYCIVTIECKSVLDNMNHLKAGHSAYVPENGYMLQNYKVWYQSDFTAYDLLKQSCDENNIKLTANQSGYGIYVTGINNLDEFDCGNESGWLYYVNGKQLPVGCDKYTVSSGDEIVFSYTCGY